MTTFFSPTPPTSPLDMPTQALSRRPTTRPLGRQPSTRLGRALTFGGSLVMTAIASWQMALVLPLAQALNTSTSAVPWLAVLLWLLLGLFTLCFGWIALSASAAVAGLFAGQGTQRAEPDAPLRGRTVLLMPIYNEDAASACAGLAAMGESLANLGVQEAFEIFVLSDTDKPDVLAAEATAVQCLRDHLNEVMPVWYRHRAHNSERKAGNIRDFIHQWGNGYDYMVVLDADSLIDGDTLASLVREMDADPSTGLLQTLPRQYGGETLFARLQQFAGAAYGSVFARGLCAWQGDAGNYWGHNAIIRIQAFAESAGLPSLPGPRPFGGEIRSHDFVEAALMRRAGWSVRMLPELAGSWEECPPTLMDAAIRDRRWAQGNIQHLAVVKARGLHWPNRAHMLMGVMNYLTSLLWLGMVAVGLILSTYIALQPTETPTIALPIFDSERMFGIFIATVVLLLLPKLLGLVGALLSQQRRGGVGRLRLLLSALVELVFSVLHAPVFMLIHSQHLWGIARGRDSGWSTQQRQSRGVRWPLLMDQHWLHTVLGLLVLALLVWLSTDLVYWMLPMVVGLLLAVPLAALSGSDFIGRQAKAWGLLATSEDITQPDIMKQRQAFLATVRAAMVTSSA